ncbi:MAG: hypothetical protein WCV67_10300 [Victivallaceae bacterium]|jgi:hypothetical protein
MPGLLTCRTAIIAATACSLILTVSCASSRRMARSSPFAGEPESNIRQTAKSGTDSSLKLARKTDNPAELNVNQERINFWPLVYSRPELFTILWPMADFDKNGMAIRPFYVRDGNEYSVMFPLAAWNPVNKDGWVLNTYWEKSFNGSFPLYHLGPKFSYVMPVWWTPDSIGFPGFCFSRNPGLNYGGPFWYNSASGSGGFFPLCYHKSSNYGWFFPLYYYDQTENNSTYLPMFGLLGHYRNNYGNKSLMALIYYHSRTKDDNTVNDMLPPLYLYRQNDGWRTFLTLPFMYGSDSKSGDYWVNVMGPLYYHSINEDKSYTGIMLPLGGYSGSPEESAAWAAPFFFKGKDKTSDYMFLFPYYCESNTAGTEYIRSLIPFYYQKKTPETSDLWLFPYYQSSDKDTFSRSVMPFYYQKTAPAASDLWIFPYYHGTDKDTVTSAVLPFYHQKNSPDENSLWLFPYYQGTDKDTVTSAVLPFYHQKNSPDENSLWLFPYYQYSEKDKPFSCAAFPLFYYGGKENNLLIMPLLSNFSSKRADILFPLIGYGYKKSSFRFWPVVSVNEDFPSLLVNVDNEGFSFIGPFGFKYYHNKTDQREETEIRSLLLMSSSCAKGDQVFPYSQNMIESRKDFYFLYIRTAERNKVWNPALIEQKDAIEISNNYQQYWFYIQLKSKNEMAETRSRLIAAMQKYGMQAKCETEEELMQEIKKFNSKYTAVENKGDTVVLPLFFSGYKETPIKFNSTKSAFSKTGYSLLIPLYYSSFENDESYTNVLFFMAESASRPNYSSFRILRYLYHAEEQNDKYSYDIFPFISARGSKEFSSYSFGWHLLDVRRDKQTGKRSGHICFIPF